MLILKVSYAEKDEVKQLGAKWNATRKTWYVPDGVAAAPFERWISETQPADALVAGAKTSKPGAAAPGRVDTLAGKVSAGKHFFIVEHDCNPFLACETCQPLLESSGWAAARRQVAIA